MSSVGPRRTPERPGYTSGRSEGGGLGAAGPCARGRRAEVGGLPTHVGTRAGGCDTDGSKPSQRARGGEVVGAPVRFARPRRRGRPGASAAMSSARDARSAETRARGAVARPVGAGWRASSRARTMTPSPPQAGRSVRRACGSRCTSSSWAPTSSWAGVRPDGRLPAHDARKATEASRGRGRSSPGAHGIADRLGEAGPVEPRRASTSCPRPAHAADGGRRGGQRRRLFRPGAAGEPRGPPRGPRALRDGERLGAPPQRHHRAGDALRGAALRRRGPCGVAWLARLSRRSTPPPTRRPTSRNAPDPLGLSAAVLPEPGRRARRPRPLRRIAAGARSLRRGDFGATIDVNSRDEIGEGGRRARAPPRSSRAAPHGGRRPGHAQGAARRPAGRGDPLRRRPARRRSTGRRGCSAGWRRRPSSSGPRRSRLPGCACRRPGAP